MSVGSLTHWLRELSDTVFAQGAETWTDAELLQSFFTAGREAAFAALVHRHGPMVWRLCRAMIQDAQAAEDAFQATFLILVQKATSIRRPELLGNWLYGVAYRVAVRARAHAARRRAREREGPDMIPAKLEDETLRRDVQPIVHEELERLPEKYRAPLLLCYFQGKTREEAARLLRWPLGTVKGRIARATDLLRARFTRRGLVLSAAAAARVLAEPNPAEAAVPPALLQSTIQAALRAAAGTAVAGAVSAPVANLTRGVMRAMFLTKIKLTGAVMLVLLLVLVAGLLASRTPPVEAVQAETNYPTKVAEQPQEDRAKEAAAWMQSQKNIHNISYAMHEYHDVLGTFPPVAVLDKNKKPLLSWRVLLLQYLGEQALFKEFKLDEPWDSAHNKKLLAKMPRVYAPVTGKAAEPGMTYYQVFTGPGTAFEGTRGLRIWDFIDGTSNTALLIEAGEPVPWTKPADLVYDPKKPLPKLGGLFKDRIHCGLADGSVMPIRRDFVEKAMRILIVRNDGEINNFADLLVEK
jgi:RNA polymerase sigma factor (sigma-70 family)